MEYLRVNTIQMTRGDAIGSKMYELKNKRKQFQEEASVHNTLS